MRFPAPTTDKFVFVFVCVCVDGMNAGVWQRSYSSGIAIVNPTTSDLAQTLPVLPTGLLWQDLYGDGVGTSVTVPAGGGLVLLKVKL